jgi:hypothetical protein
MCLQNTSLLNRMRHCPFAHVFGFKRRQNETSPTLRVSLYSERRTEREHQRTTVKNRIFNFFIISIYNWFYRYYFLLTKRISHSKVERTPIVVIIIIIIIIMIIIIIIMIIIIIL